MYYAVNENIINGNHCGLVSFSKMKIACLTNITDDLTQVRFNCSKNLQRHSYLLTYCMTKNRCAVNLNCNEELQKYVVK